jgi:hypothetical protein
MLHIMLKFINQTQDEWVGTITQVISVLFKGRSAENIRDGLRNVQVDIVITSESSKKDDKITVLSNELNLFILKAISSI